MKGATSKLQTIVLQCAILFVAGAALAADPSEILRRADEARGNIAGQGVEWTIHVTTTHEEETKEMQLRVVASGPNMLTEILAPEKSKGQRILATGGDMWFYKPGLSRVVAIPRRQKLLGDASVGDIAATDYANDYVATPAGDETVDGVPCHVFDLKAKGHNVTYEQIRYWVEKDRHAPKKAEFYSTSGKKLKTALYVCKELEAAGKTRPFVTQMTIIDELTKDKVTTLDFSAPTPKKIGDNIFTVDNLKSPTAIP